MDYWAIDPAALHRQNHIVFGALCGPGKGQRGQPPRQPGPALTSNVYTSSTPNAQSGRHPHRPLTSLRPFPRASSHKNRIRP